MEPVGTSRDLSSKTVGQRILAILSIASPFLLDSTHILSDFYSNAVSLGCRESK